MVLSLIGCGSSKETTAGTSADDTSAEETSGETQEAEAEDSGEAKALKIAMGCGYAPYNWTQPDDSNGPFLLMTVPIMHTVMML